MNDFAISTQFIPKSGLQGLPQRLVADGLVSDTQMVEALNAAKERRVNIVPYLVEYNLADPREIAIAASQEFGAPLLDLDSIQADLDTVRIVSEKVLRKHRVMPLVKRGKKLFVAISDPTNLHALDEVKFATGLSVEAVVVEEDKLDRMLSQSLEQVDTSMPELAGEDFEMDSLEVSGGDDEGPNADERSDAVDDAPIVRFVNKVMVDAIKRGASDIHFEPYERSYRIRFRLDGVLKEVATPPVQLAVKLAARLKVMSRLDIAERRVPQDGRIKMKISKNRAIDFRLSTCPTLFGEKIVMRILDPSSAMLGIDALGYEPFQKQHYMDTLARPHGMILVTGPTGSGKTVSLYTCLNILNQPGVNISTVEDPAEINLPGINQVNVNDKAGLTFAAALKSFLRQDPDVIMVGEIRDLETADIAIKAAQTGHMVMSTLHTNDAPTTLTRLLNMGVAPFNIASAVLLITAQRLGRKLCENCKTPADYPREAMLKAGFQETDLDGSWKPYRAVGCSSCSNGYKGRVGIYQVMPISEEIQRLILAEGTAMDLASQAQREGVRDLRQSGLIKVRAGVTTLEEVISVTNE